MLFREVGIISLRGESSSFLSSANLMIESSSKFKAWFEGCDF